MVIGKCTAARRWRDRLLPDNHCRWKSARLKTLTGGRAGLPVYFPLGEYHTFVIPLRQRRDSWHEGDLEIRPLQRNEFPALIDFLRETGKSKLFFPCYAQEDFLGPQATFQDLRQRIF